MISCNLPSTLKKFLEVGEYKETKKDATKTTGDHPLKENTSVLSTFSDFGFPSQSNDEEVCVAVSIPRNRPVVFDTTTIRSSSAIKEMEKIHDHELAIHYFKLSEKRVARVDCYKESTWL